MSTNGLLNVSGVDGNGGGSGGGGSTFPGGIDKSVQFNDGGLMFGGVSSFLYDKVSAVLSVNKAKPVQIIDTSNSTGTAGQVLSSTGTGLQYITPTPPTVPAAPPASIQFNNGGVFGGDADFTYDTLSDTLNVVGISCSGIGAGKVDANLLEPVQIVDDVNSTGTAGQLLSSTGTGIHFVDPPATVPGGNNQYVQYNDLGAFGGDVGFQYDNSTQKISVNGIITNTIRPGDIEDSTLSTGFNGQYLTNNGTLGSSLVWADLPPYPTTYPPSAPTNSIQFNNGGVFGGSANFVLDPSTNAVNINGNVGIGSLSTPAHRLQVTGANATINSTSTTGLSTLLLTDTSAPASQKQFTFQLNGPSNTGDIISIQQGAQFRPIRLNPSATLGQARVSIGTTDANAVLQLDQSLTNRKIVLFQGANNDHQYFGFGVQANLLRQNVSGTGDTFGWFAGTGTGTSNEVMRLTGTGNLQVGSSGAGSSRIFALSGTAAYDVGGAWTNQWITAGASTATNSSAIGLGWNTAGLYGTLSCVTPGAAYRDIRYCGARHLFFNGTTSTMNIGTGGDVLIGQQGTANLSITKSSLGTNAPDTVPTGTYLKLGGTEYRSGTSGAYHLIGFGYNTGSNNMPAYIGYLETNGGGDSLGALVFGTRSVTTGNVIPTERMRISPLGNVSIGNTNNTFPLEVTGTIRSTSSRPDTILDTTNSAGTAGQILSSTGTGISWVNNPASIRYTAQFSANVRVTLSPGVNAVTLRTETFATGLYFPLPPPLNVFEVLQTGTYQCTYHIDFENTGSGNALFTTSLRRFTPSVVSLQPQQTTVGANQFGQLGDSFFVSMVAGEYWNLAINCTNTCAYTNVNLVFQTI